MFLTTLLVASLAAPVPKEKPVYYFPTTVGAKRVMEGTVNDQTTEATEEVTKVEEKDGTLTVTMEWPAFGKTAVGTFEVTDKKVRRVGVKELGDYTILDLGVKAGETWTSESTIIDTKRVVTYTLGKEEVVEVPAGKFKAVPVTEQSENSVRTTTKWYAPGVGMVKSSSETKAAKVVVVLKEFKPGKEEKK